MKQKKTNEKRQHRRTNTTLSAYKWIYLGAHATRILWIFMWLDKLSRKELVSMKNLLVFPVTYHFTNCKVLSDLIPFIVSFPLFFFSILKRKLILFEAHCFSVSTWTGVYELWHECSKITKWQHIKFSQQCPIS